VWFTNTGNNSIGRVDLLPVVVPGGASVVEGNSGTVNLHVPVTLSKPSIQTTTVQWATGPAGPYRAPIRRATSRPRAER